MEVRNLPLENTVPEQSTTPVRNYRDGIVFFIFGCFFMWGGLHWLPRAWDMVQNGGIKWKDVLVGFTSIPTALVFLYVSFTELGIIGLKGQKRIEDTWGFIFKAIGFCVLAGIVFWIGSLVFGAIASMSVTTLLVIIIVILLFK
jgi:hypothetical protein